MIMLVASFGCPPLRLAAHFYFHGNASFCANSIVVGRRTCKNCKVSNLPLHRDIYVFESLSDAPTRRGGHEPSTGNGRNLLAAADAEATDIRKDESSGSEWQG